MAAAVRILLVDDHAVVRAGYRRYLEQEAGHQVIAEASSGEEAYSFLQQQRDLPDITILDLSMPGRGGLSTLERLKQRWPRLPVLVCSMHDHTAFVVQAMRAGADGYVTKGSDPAFMVTAVRRVLAGAPALSPDVADRMSRSMTGGEDQPTRGLSVREFEIFRLIALGKTHEEIAAALNLSIKTVANNHSLIRQKLAIQTDIELFRLAVGCGVVATS